MKLKRKKRAYSDLSLEKKRSLRPKMLAYYAKQGLTVAQADKIIEKLSLDQKMEIISKLDEHK